MRHVPVRDVVAVPGIARADAASRAVPRPGVSATDWISLLRPTQWIKNFFILAPLVFSGKLTDPIALSRAGIAFLLFSMVASGIYCWNDVIDAAADRSHPVKRYRPIAAGRILPLHGAAGGTLLVLCSIAGGLWLGNTFALVVLGYVVLNAVYSLWMKHTVILDVFGIAAFFILRLLAGASAVAVHPSIWLLLCGGLLALYLGFAKRRHELLLLGEDSASHRSVLSQYDAALLDQLSTILLSVTVVAYIMYTLSSATAVMVGPETLSYSTVFVLYGVFRYLLLVRRHSQGGNPAETLLADRMLLIDVSLWMMYCGWAIYRPF